jgi:hypothetical protein
MTGTDVTEHVARAICRAECFACGPDLACHGFIVYGRQARAAIAAVRAWDEANLARADEPPVETPAPVAGWEPL